MWDSLIEFWFPAGFMPHGHCYLWRPGVVWLHALSDAIIALSYFSIPFALLVFVRRRSDVAFRWVFLLFSVFILSCGVTHVFGVIDIWYPAYWLDGIAKAVTAVASALCAIVLWPLIPRAVALPSPAELAETNKALEQQITERLRVEEALRVVHAEMEEQSRQRLLEKSRELERESSARKEAERRYAELFEQAPDGVVLVDLRTAAIAQFNPAAHRQLNYEREEFARLKVTDLLVMSDPGELSRRAEQVVAKGHDAFESRLRTKDGKERQVEVTLNRAKIDGSDFALCVLRDVSVRWQLQQEQAKAQRLESVGVLAGGIAHDFNNLLTAILGNVSMARSQIAEGLPAEDLLEQSEAACRRARGLTQQLLTFAKGGAPIKRRCSVADVVRESAAFAVRGSNVRCDFRSASDLKVAEIDAGQIGQVMHNLVLNAVQAMPGGGVVRVTCENVREDGSSSLPQGDYVRIAVQDDGPGISAAIQERIFEPYFTTKATGSGLGLASSHSIVSQHGGRLEVASSPGAGATFSFLLPAAAPAAVPTSPPVLMVAHQRPLRVLVMDDEPMIRRVAATMLRRLGHEAVCAASGEEALEVYTQDLRANRHFDAVILDLTVPGGIGGAEVSRQLHQLDPSVRTIVSSGYASDGGLAHSADAGFSGLLVKPYDLRELQRALAELGDLVT